MGSWRSVVEVKIAELKYRFSEAVSQYMK